MTSYCEFTIRVNRPVRHVERVAELDRRQLPATPPDSSGPQAADGVPALLSEIAGELRGWRSVHAEFATVFREAVVQLSLAIADRIVRDRIDADAYNLPDLLEEIWNRLDHGAVDLFLHPEDLQQLNARHGAWVREHVETSPIQLRPDPSLPRGTCRVEGQHESFLAGVDVEFAGLTEWLKGDTAG